MYFSIALVVVAILGGIAGSLYQKHLHSSDVRSLAYYQQTMLRQQGGTLHIPQYELLSFDGGKRWYAVDRDHEGAVVILGPAEEIYPGLVAQNQGMDALIQHVMEHGPISLANTSEVALLENAGFTVERISATK